MHIHSTYSLSLKKSFNVLLNFLEYRTNSRFRISKTCKNRKGKRKHLTAVRVKVRENGRKKKIYKKFQLSLKKTSHQYVTDKWIDDLIALIIYDHTVINIDIQLQHCIFYSTVNLEFTRISDYDTNVSTDEHFSFKHSSSHKNQHSVLAPCHWLVVTYSHQSLYHKSIP